MLKKVSDTISHAQSNVECIGLESAKKLYDEGKKIIILDVRNQDSVSQSKLSMSVSVPRNLISHRIPVICPDLDSIILIHCVNGGRASLTALELKDMGYDNVYVVLEKYAQIKKIFG